MDILLKGATIIDPSSPFHLALKDLFISAGVIVWIGDASEHSADQVIDIPGLLVSPGWVDLFADLGDPGFEHRETLETGSMAAAAGGYTDVLVLPHTNPVLQNKAGCSYIIEKSRPLHVNFHPVGAVTANADGIALTEMYDMEESGAVAFSDGCNPIQSAGVLLKALQYVKAISKTIIQMPDDRSISPHGLMNEGIISTRLGLPGKPAIAEELMIARDLELVRYTGSRLHFTGVSTATGIDLIRRAKVDGMAVTCSVTPHHLFFVDEDLADYDTNLKVLPPLRSAMDRLALITAISDGTVDCIASHHAPHDSDSKVVEFEYAKNGTISLQTAFAVARTSLTDVSPTKLVELFSTNATAIFGLSPKTIAVDAAASLTLFAMEKEWSPSMESNYSRSRNSPFFGKRLKGKALGIINKDKVFLNQL